MFGIPVLSVLTPTRTRVWIPTLYPEPLFPILIDWIVPAEDTTAVPPAATSGWYPNPWLEPIDRIIPPLGTLAALTSYVFELEFPVKVIVVIPEFSAKL